MKIRTGNNILNRRDEGAKNTMQELQILLQHNFDDLIGDLEQVDDVCVIGIKI